MKVYLAGPIQARSLKDIHGWRNQAKDLLGDIETLNPADNLYKGLVITKATAARLVNKDKSDIDKSDVVLAYFDRPSVGTIMEILYGWERDKKVLIVNASGRQVSPWLVHHSFKIFTNLDKACQAIKLLD